MFNIKLSFSLFLRLKHDLMLKISKLTDYATILLIHLSRFKKPTSSSVLATETGVPEPTVAKVLKMLTRASLVKSCRGAGSGYSLSFPLKEITLAQVVVAIEGPIDLVNCDKDNCRLIAEECELYGKWEAISFQLRNVFENITIADLQDKKSMTHSC
ncbi:DNA-binding transcriptional regulator [Commensalibacter papalotli (ex Botero et al. 2024)]|uniref:IscR family (IscR) (PDB:1XD7) n=2 Tax=Commensalibacter papalotli (ex Botero et al. 2024) TaxID=2972766 RepID=A0ABM9HQP0_9PROT|nr:DNA-binding transcriptional regulator [Commensalibacter papalotli (ex Botero et al. 2024)]CAI3945235.1 DNA-binding transcriptional regulator [Commensalibacter papalotli (ex Botero et al. 2024)]